MTPDQADYALVHLERAKMALTGHLNPGVALAELGRALEILAPKPVSVEWREPAVAETNPYANRHHHPGYSDV